MSVSMCVRKRGIGGGGGAGGSRFALCHIYRGGIWGSDPLQAAAAAAASLMVAVIVSVLPVSVIALGTKKQRRRLHYWVDVNLAESLRPGPTVWCRPGAQLGSRTEGESARLLEALAVMYSTPPIPITNTHPSCPPTSPSPIFPL